MRTGSHKSPINQGVSGNYGSIYLLRPALQPFPQFFCIGRSRTGRQQIFRRRIDFIACRFHNLHRIRKADRTVIQRDKQKGRFIFRQRCHSGKHAQYETEQCYKTLKQMLSVHDKAQNSPLIGKHNTPF